MINRLFTKFDKKPCDSINSKIQIGNKKYDIDSLLQFSYVLKNINYLSDKSSIAISINAKNIIIQKNNFSRLYEEFL